MYTVTIKIFSETNKDLLTTLYNNNYLNQFSDNMKAMMDTVLLNQVINSKYEVEYFKIDTFIDQSDLLNSLTFKLNEIQVRDEYDSIIERENHMRKYMYDPRYTKDLMNTDNYYNLIKLDENLWNSIVIGDTSNMNDVLFNGKKLNKRSWEEIQNDVLEVRKYMRTGMLVAGGKIFSILFGTQSHDIDIFLYGQEYDNAVNTIIGYTNDYINDLKKLVRTKNAVTFVVRDKDEIQIILRLYRTVSEILHGFDVDSCSMGYDGENIYLTERALYAIQHGYNTVNFDRLSNSYEARLAKYGTRGMAVKIPNFDKNKINMEKLMGTWEAFYTPKDRYKYIKNDLKGLDKLIFLDYHIQGRVYFGGRGQFQTKYAGKFVSKSVEKLAEESSDYNPVPFIHRESVPLNVIINYIYTKGKIKFPELNNLNDEDLMQLNNMYNIEQIITTRIPKADKIYFLGVISGWSNIKNDTAMQILNIPDLMYRALEQIRPWYISQNVELKTINPGEQMTGTFHKTVLDNNDIWYKGIFY